MMHQIHTLALGVMDNFVHIVADCSTGEAMVVDPAWDVAEIEKVLIDNQWTLTGILLTHSHADHIAAVKDVLSFADVPVYITAEEFRLGFLRITKKPTYIKDNDVIQLGKTEIRVMATPGHTVGSACYWINGKDLIVGDTLFVDGCGRCNFLESDVEKMYESLQRLKSLPDEVVIHCGHHYGQKKTDTLGNQRKTNPYLLIDDRAFFIQFRMELQAHYRQIPFSPSSLEEMQRIYCQNNS